MLLGKLLSDYSLSCPPKQGANKHGSGVACHCPQGHTPQGHSRGTARSASPALPSVSSQRPSKPLLVNAPLSIVKAYWLKGDIESQKNVCEHFSPADVDVAKMFLW